MTLPADPETEHLARRVAETTGKPLSLVVREAIAAKAEAAGLAAEVRTKPSRDALLARMIEITDGFADLPVLDPRPADEIIGYDEFGLPK